MHDGARWARWRPAVAVALVLAGAWVAVGFVPHAVGGFGDDPVVTDPGPPPSVDAFRDDPRKRYRNRVANRLVAFAPVAAPVLGALVGFAAVGRRPPSGGGNEGVRATVAAAGRVGAGAFVGAAVGYVLFVAVATQAYAAVPGGYVLESYPPTVSVAAVAGNAVVAGALTATGALLAALARGGGGG